MGDKEREIVHFSVGFGIFQNDDEVTDGWSVSETLHQHQGQNLCMEEEDELEQEVAFIEGSQELDKKPAGQCHIEVCKDRSEHLLSPEESNILEIRERVRLGQLCTSHYSKLLTNYSAFQHACSNPYQVHTKKVKSDLVVISADMHKKNPIFIPGQKVCRKCRTRHTNEEDVSGADGGGEGDEGAGGGVDEGAGGGGDEGAGGGVDEGAGGGGDDGAAGGGGQWEGLEDSQRSAASSVHIWSQEYEKDKRFEKVNEALSILDMSPVKKHQLRSRSEMNEKLSKICDSIKKQLCIEELCPKTPEAEALLQSMKAQFNRAVDRCEKYKILTSLPENWTEYQISREFGCSNTMARDALKLRSVHGPGSTPGLKAGHRIPNEVASKVIQFYTAMDVSREMPGKKDCITVREGRTKTVKQKRLLLSNLREAYIQFKQINPDLAIGFSTFASLRPREVILAGMYSKYLFCAIQMIIFRKFWNACGVLLCSLHEPSACFAR